MNKAILVISDTHYPYNHPDVFAFLRALNKKYKFDKIVHIGDELDHHAASFHEHNPDLHSHGHELETAIKRLQPIYKLFPEVDLLESNHGSLTFRKALAYGIASRALKPYRELIEAPRGWKWHTDLILKASDGNRIYFHHGKGSDIMKVSQAMGMSCVQGHYHNSFEIKYWGNPLNLYFGMTVGCLIENESLAFAYNKVNLKRPVIGCGGILRGHPKLFPMVLNNKGRWIGELV